MGQSWDWIKDKWKIGDYRSVSILIFDRLPQLTFPFGDMDALFEEYGYWKFTGPMALATWWRELWHFIGGALITLPSMSWPPMCFVTSIGVAIWKGFSEYYEHEETDLKNVVDWISWIAGSLLVTVISYFLFGSSTYQ